MGTISKKTLGYFGARFTDLLPLLTPKSILGSNNALNTYDPLSLLRWFRGVEYGPHYS